MKYETVVTVRETSVLLAELVLLPVEVIAARMRKNRKSSVEALNHKIAGRNPERKNGGFTLANIILYRVN